MSGEFHPHGAIISAKDWYSAMYDSPPDFRHIPDDQHSKFLFDQAMSRHPPTATSPYSPPSAIPGDKYPNFLFNEVMSRQHVMSSAPVSTFRQNPINGISEMYTERFREMINQSNNEQNFLRETWDNIIKLMENGADPRIKNNDGDNILHIAIKQNVDSSIFYQLLKWCYFILNDNNVEGYTPIDLVEMLYGKDSVLWRQLHYQATTTPRY